MALRTPGSGPPAGKGLAAATNGASPPARDVAPGGVSAAPTGNRIIPGPNGGGKRQVGLAGTRKGKSQATTLKSRHGAPIPMTLRAPAILALGLILATALAGCGGKKIETTDSPEPTFGVKATATTGIIRGVVVDQAVHPIGAAKVLVNVQGKPPLTTNTTKEGLFGFQGLAPGTYFVTATKLGFSSAQTSVEVQAGVDEPKAIKLQLTADPSQLPYVEIYHFEGFVECSVSAIYLGAAACAVPNAFCGPLDPVPASGPCNVTKDNFLASYTPSGNMSFAQSEMVWTSTQASGDIMNLEYAVPPTPYVQNGSSSPVTVKANASILKANVNADSPNLIVRVFAGGVSGTNPGDFPDPSSATCTAGVFCVCTGPDGSCQVGGAGVTFEQKIDIYTVLFYGFRPPTDYSFVKDGEPQVPTA